MLIKNKNNIIEFILANLFVLNISVAAISNYSFYIFLLKGIVSVLLVVAAITDYNSKKLEISNKHFLKGLKQVSLITIIFLSYLAITLTYSSDVNYGFQKILNFLISVVPAILVSYYLLFTWSQKRLQILIYSLVIIAIVTVVYIIIDYPFDPGSIYKYRAGRWSHVIYGRTIGSIAVVLMLYVFWMIEKLEKLEVRSEKKAELRKIVFFILVTSISVYGLYLSSLRSAMLGVVLFLVLGFLYIVYELVARSEKREVRRYQLLGIALVIIFTLTLIIVIPKPQIIDTRFDNLTKIEDLNFGGDEPISSRIEALRISWELIKERPVFGVGFGGFRSYNNFTEAVKYPHNIFLEMAVEGGVVGVFVLCLLLFVLSKYTYRYSRLAFIFLVFSFFLTLFSKELSNQGLLWIGIAFIALSKWNTDNTDKTDLH